MNILFGQYNLKIRRIENNKWNIIAIFGKNNIAKLMEGVLKTVCNEEEHNG